MTIGPSDTQFAESVIENCVEHARTVLAAQLPAVAARNFDFMPEFMKMMTDLYLVGVMWRFGEQFDLPTSPRDRGYICLMAMLIKDGMGERAAKRRLAFLLQNSKNPGSNSEVFLSLGYQAGTKIDALATMFETYRHNPEMAGAPWRLIKSVKSIAVALSLAGVAISIMSGRTIGEAIGIALVLGLVTLVIGKIIFRQMTNANRT